jgi:hypothetical protein
MYLSDSGGFGDLVEQDVPDRLVLDGELQLAVVRRHADADRGFRHLGVVTLVALVNVLTTFSH